MSPLAIHTDSGIIRDYPTNIIEHAILGANIELYVEPVEDEEDKVVIEKRVYPKKSDALAEDAVVHNTEQESAMTKTFKQGVKG